MDEAVHMLGMHDVLHINDLGLFWEGARVKPYVFIQFAVVAEL